MEDTTTKDTITMNIAGRQMEIQELKNNLRSEK